MTLSPPADDLDRSRTTSTGQSSMTTQPLSSTTSSTASIRFNPHIFNAATSNPTAASSRRPSDAPAPPMASQQQQQPAPTSQQTAQMSLPHKAGSCGGGGDSRRGSTASLGPCAACAEDRIRGWRDIREAFVLTWRSQQGHLFTSWIHVPLGVVSLLFVVWLIKLGIDKAPFRFPSPVLAMLAIFGLLLLLDWLSIRFPGTSADQDKIQDVEKQDGDRRSASRNRKRKRFVDPVMKLLAPPCDFCLRNMSVMFTPSFILIPARETIPGKEIGLLAAWFAITQVLAFVFPVLLNWVINWFWTMPQRRADAKAERENDKYSRSRRGSTATMAGMDFEKRVSFSVPGGGPSIRLGPVATGLSGITAIITAPVSHAPIHLEDDQLSQLEGVELERARQQGEPAIRSPAIFSSAFPQSPRSNVSSFQHFNPPRGRGHHHHHHLRRAHSDMPSSAPSAGRRFSRSRSRERQRGRSTEPVEIPIAEQPALPLSLPSTPEQEYRFPSMPPPTLQRGIAFEEDLPTAASERAALEVMEQTTETQSPSDEETTAVSSRRASVFDSRRSSKAGISVDTKAAPISSDGKPSVTIQEGAEDSATTAASGQNFYHGRRVSCTSVSSHCGPDAVERLSSWISDLITPAIYFCMFIIGLPLWFKLNFALPLFLGINLLTFLAAITIVPPKVRRFLHPILSTSLATVLLIWAFGAMSGKSIKETLAYYDRDATYKQLWALEGYRGSVPGAGDILFSTLDAGIVALAVPMYRYRIDLRDNFVRMMLVLIPCASLSLFVWPSIAALMGMDEIRSLSFAARFMSTPLAIEMANTIGADESITVILVVITGIIAAILKDPFFRMMRVEKDDHLAIGVTFGATSGAIGASSLISQPRVMAVASLSFVLFGGLLLIAAAIPPIVQVVQSLVGMPV